MSNLRVGTIVNGTVIVVEEKLAYISVGGKSEGRMYLEYYTSNKDVKSLADCLKVGDQIRVQVAKITDGLVLLSRLEMEEKEKRDKVIKKIMNHKPFTATVTGKNKDGDFLLNKDGVNLYLPSKYVDLDANFDADSIIKTDVKVVFVRTEQVDERKTRFVVSRKQVQYNEERKARSSEFENINVDDVVKGTVSQFTPFGAFIKLNAIEALCHLSEISWYRIKDASEALTIGQEVEVKVIKKTETRVHVSIKALTKSPWELFRENHQVGDTLECEIVKKADSFMLVSPEKDVVGILNQYDYSWKRDDNFAGSVEVGDKITLKITYLDKDNNKMTLSKKHLEYNPWADLTIKMHEIVTGTVLRFTNTGAIVKVGNVEGFLSNNDASSTGKVASDIFKVGDTINAEVVKLNPQRWILTLSIRTIEERETQKFVDKYLEENVEAKQSLDDLI